MQHSQHEQAGGGWIWACALILAALGLVCSSSSGGQSARDIAQALADRMSSDMEFEDGEEVPGPPPEAHDGDPAYPQVYYYGAPPMVGGSSGVDYGTYFDITLQATGDTGVVEGALGAIVHIEQANKTDTASSHIRIEPTPPAVVGDMMTLRARVNVSDALPGNAFHVRMAMMRADGAIGNWVSWNLYTAPVGGAATLVPSCYCGYGIDYEGDYGLTWSMVKFAGSCADEQLRSVFYGNGPEAMPEPCMLWDDAASNGNGQWMGGQDWPSGTRFDIQWGEAAPCTLELDCSQEPSHDHEEWD